MLLLRQRLRLLEVWLLWCMAAAGHLAPDLAFLAVRPPDASTAHLLFLLLLSAALCLLPTALPRSAPFSRCCHTQDVPDDDLLFLRCAFMTWVPLHMVNGCCGI
jgi:hypothetical protein